MKINWAKLAADTNGSFLMETNAVRRCSDGDKASAKVLVNPSETRIPVLVATKNNENLFRRKSKASLALIIS